jgi:hypothetical protein
MNQIEIWGFEKILPSFDKTHKTWYPSNKFTKQKNKPMKNIKNKNQ